MTGIFPRRQAARLGERLGKHFAPGLICLEAPPRRGRSDFLRQLFAALAAGRAVAPALLPLGGRRLPEAAGEQSAAQWLAFTEGSLRSPLVFLSRAGLAEREDVGAWQGFLGVCAGGPSPEKFFTAAALLAECAGPLCLLLDDASEDVLRAAGALTASKLAIVAAPAAHGFWEGAQVLALEELNVREGVLLAEGIARQVGLEFSGATAEPFVAYTKSDPFVLDAVVRRAASSGLPLTSAKNFVRAYLDELRSGTLAAYFRSRLPGEPGGGERRFVLELLAADKFDAQRVANWRHRLAVEAVLDVLHALGWLAVHGAQWAPRNWPALRDWALLEGAHPSLERAEGALSLRVFSEIEAAAEIHASEQVASCIAEGLAALVPGAAAWLAANGVAGAQVPEVVHVVMEKLAGGDLFLCYGFAEGARRADSSALLAVVLAENSPASQPGRLSSLVEEMSRRVAEIAAGLAGASPVPPEKWLVVKNPGGPEAELARRTGTRLLDFALFNRLIAREPEPASEGAGADAVIRLPMKPDYEIAAARVLDHLLERHTWPKRAAAQARIALVEACLNAIEHGRAAKLDPAEAFMEIRLSAGDAGIEMAVSNPGPPFQPEGAQTGEGAGAGVHRGHGLKIIRSVMDRVSFSSDLTGTTIRMFKRLPATRPGRAPGSLDDEKTTTGIERD